MRIKTEEDQILTEKMSEELTMENAITFVNYINELFVPEVIINSTCKQPAIEEAHKKYGGFTMTILIGRSTSYKHNIVPPLYILIRDESYKMFDTLQAAVFRLTFDGKHDGLISDEARYAALNIVFDRVVGDIYSAAIYEIFSKQDRLTNGEMNDLLAAVANDYLNYFFNEFMQTLDGLKLLMQHSEDKHAKNVIYRINLILEAEELGGE